MSTAATFAGLLRRRARERGDAVALRLSDLGAATEAWSYAALWERGCRVAAGLRAAGVSPGQRVLVLAPEVREAVAAHVGAWALGAAPIHLGLPYRLSDPAAFLAELRGLAARLRAAALLLSRSVAPFAPPGEARALPIAALLASATPEDHDVDPDAQAPPDLIQLTSGSTRDPRAVVIPHRRLLRHLDAIAAALPPGEAAAGVSWLPLYHDMGLIGGLLHPLHAGFPVHLLSPLLFRSRPYAWLQALAADRATHTAGPPSAYALLLRLAGRAAAEGLRLSRLRCAMIGAEPTSPELLERFAGAFAPTGFDGRAFFPVYGLAEATVAVTFPRPFRAATVAVVDRDALGREGRARPPGAAERRLLSVGRPLPGTELRICDEQNDSLRECAEDEVGEIWVRSRSLMSGYDGDATATAAALRDGWLRSGDLGFLRGGELFITGRRKDLIIKGGHNLHPEPLEALASEVEGVRPGCVAAIGVPCPRSESERAVLVAETRLPAGEWPALRERLREALRGAGAAVDEVLLVPPGTLPRTTSGKLRRGAVAEACGLTA